MVVSKEKTSTLSKKKLSTEFLIAEDGYKLRHTVFVTVICHHKCDIVTNSPNNPFLILYLSNACNMFCLSLKFMEMVR